VALHDRRSGEQHRGANPQPSDHLPKVARKVLDLIRIQRTTQEKTAQWRSVSAAMDNRRLNRCLRQRAE
jgi:hypothetical protein